jgi:hypothetical protein
VAACTFNATTLAPPTYPVLADMRSDIQEIFKLTPQEKQVMMFSATLSGEMRAVCKKFMSNVSSFPRPVTLWRGARPLYYGGFVSLVQS